MISLATMAAVTCQDGIFGIKPRVFSVIIHIF